METKIRTGKDERAATDFPKRTDRTEPNGDFPMAKNTSKTAKTSPKTDATPERADGLRDSQVRVLQVLSKAKEPLSRTEIKDKAELSSSILQIGSPDLDLRKTNDKDHYPSLLSLKMISEEEVEGKRGQCYSITAKGKAAVKK
jgi:hypothetical protein